MNNKALAALATSVTALYANAEPKNDVPVQAFVNAWLDKRLGHDRPDTMAGNIELLRFRVPVEINGPDDVLDFLADLIVEKSTDENGAPRFFEAQDVIQWFEDEWGNTDPLLGGLDDEQEMWDDVAEKIGDLAAYGLLVENHGYDGFIIA